MAYVFNDDKSKANIVVFETTMTVRGNADGWKVISASELADLGISDIHKYELIGFSQTISGVTGRLYHPAYRLRDGADVNSIEVEPFVQALHTGDLNIYAYNSASGGSRTFTFRLVFMEVA